MENTQISVNPGDWVRVAPLWPGIWKVDRVLAGFNEVEWSLSVPPKTSNRALVFCHRIVNDSWKRSFSHQSCELSCVRPVEPEEKWRLDALLASDGKLSEAFERYCLKPDRIDLIANIGFGGLKKKEISRFSKRCEQTFAGRINAGLSIPETLQLLADHGLEKNRHELPQQLTLQLICIDHELRDNDFVHREYRILSF